MTLVCPNVGEVILLSYMLNKTAVASGPVLRLFTNNVTPGETTTIEALTECSDAGYTRHTLVGAGWSVGTAGGDTTTASYSEETFNFATTASVYGYYVTAANNTDLLWLERFEGSPFVLPSGGGTIAITPKIQLA